MPRSWCDRFTRGALGLERREEAFHRCIVPDIVGSAHAADDAAIGHLSLELFAGVLTALIRVMQQLVRLAAPPAIVGAYAGYIAGFALSYYILHRGSWGRWKRLHCVVDHSRGMASGAVLGWFGLRFIERKLLARIIFRGENVR